MEIFAQCVMWGLMVFYLASHVVIIIKANKMPDPPDYPPKEWDALQRWIESPKCFPAIILYLTAGCIFAWFVVQ